MAATQAAVSLLGLPAQEGSARITFIFVPNAVAAVRGRELVALGKSPHEAWTKEAIAGDIPEKKGEEIRTESGPDDAEFADLDFMPQLRMISRRFSVMRWVEDL